MEGAEFSARGTPARYSLLGIVEQRVHGRAWKGAQVSRRGIGFLSFMYDGDSR